MKTFSAFLTGFCAVLLLNVRQSEQFSVGNKNHAAMARHSHGTNLLQKDAARCEGFLGPQTNCVSAGSKCYCFVPKQLSWLSAFDYCRLNGMNLLSIQTLAKHQEISATLPQLVAGSQLVNEIGLWTSGTFAGALNTFIWVGQMTLFSFANWVYGAPFVSSSSDCVRAIPTSDYQWADLDCDQRLPSICEADINSLVTTANGDIVPVDKLQVASLQAVDAVQPSQSDVVNVGTAQQRQLHPNIHPPTVIDFSPMH